ncbi:MAG: hypothetical protein HPZ91_10955 [Lentisphaeria bacterium]|nr:hypothetical protein [Lentisphaeria bacterium]
MKLLIALLLAAAAPAVPGEDFTRLREQYVEVTRPAALPEKEAVEAVLAELRPDGSFSSCNYACTQRGTWRTTAHWSKLGTLSAEFRFGRNGMKGDPRLLDAVVRGVEHWAGKGYENPNWWYQSIGIPRPALTVLLRMGDAMPEETLRKFRPVLDRSKPGMTGQNRNALYSIHLLKGIAYRDGAMVREGRDGLLEGIAFAAPGREGLQPDFSFHQHGPLLQFGNYGREFFDTASMWAAVLAGTRYAYSPEQLGIVRDYFLYGLRYVLYAEVLDFSACGRQIVGDSQAGKFRSIRRSAELLQRALPPGDAEKIRAFYDAPSQFEGCRYYPYSDFLVCRRSGFYFSVRMCSGRVLAAEGTNGENQLGLYTGAGVVQLMRTGEEYRRLMPLWNWRRLPGVTAPQDGASLVPRGGFNRSGLAGGVSDGRSGAALFGLETREYSARKSCLGFGGCVAMIGSEIRSDGAAPLNTTIDSRWFRGEAKVIAADGKELLVPEGTTAYDDVSAVVHDGITYLFPEPASIMAERRRGRGTWEPIQKYNRADPVEGEVFTLWFDHGRKPRNAGYCVVAAADAQSARGFRLLPSAPGVHAGYDGGAKLALLAFHAPGAAEIPGVGTLEALQRAVVIVRDGVLTAADPAQGGEELRFRLNGKLLHVPVPPHGGASAPVTVSPRSSSDRP